MSKQDNQPISAGLWLVATPIGNAADISARALEVLTKADRVACEDTRMTAKLLSLHGLKRPLIPYHDHTSDKDRDQIIRHLKNGESVALVSDAGTPLVSDPGYKLVRACIEEGLSVTAVPGPSSVLTALQLSGLPSDRFMFAGFIPNKQGARQAFFEELKNIPATLILMESAKRLEKSLTVMADILGPREAAVTRELTKMFEEVRRGTLDKLAGHYGEAGPPKGEVTMVIAPPLVKKASTEDLDRYLIEALETQSVKEAAKSVSAALDLPKKQVYSRALALKDR